jgi:hypothetical protein
MSRVVFPENIGPKMMWSSDIIGLIEICLYLSLGVLTNGGSYERGFLRTGVLTNGGSYEPGVYEKVYRVVKKV